ncbi:hypothetical protein GCM10010123_03700 [Pilimelia anulata]|uniref:Uncharacterized protein n=1 Tax=Pilimelia anulata TaxID=53371 RepID=A0A8J3B2T3_9ACTN|nr:hypothetical protein GCM10010123_03700 [Pilimelia anulata]
MGAAAGTDALITVDTVARSECEATCWHPRGRYPDVGTRVAGPETPGAARRDAVTPGSAAYGDNGTVGLAGTRPSGRISRHRAQSPAGSNERAGGRAAPLTVVPQKRTVAKVPAGRKPQRAYARRATVL